jgi:hypothetical protein
VQGQLESPFIQLAGVDVGKAVGTPVAQSTEALNHASKVTPDPAQPSSPTQDATQQSAGASRQ